MAIMPGMVMRAPKRSSIMPTGICVAAKAKKNAPVRTPIDSEDSVSSRIRSGAMTALETR